MNDSEYAATRLALAMRANSREEFDSLLAELDKLRASQVDKKILYTIVQDERVLASGSADYLFWCPGCNCCHGVWTRKKNSLQAVWTFDGNMEKPTFSPSILVTGTKPVTDAEAEKILAGEKFEPIPIRCHSFIRAGQIQYLPDCTHELRGQTIPMEAF